MKCNNKMHQHFYMTFLIHALEIRGNKLEVTSNTIADGVNVIWKVEFPPRDLPVRQVYGLIFDEQGRMLVCNDRGRYNLPGGHPEHDEDWLQTLERECIEEAQAEYQRPMYLGYVEVTETRGGVTEVYAQLRFVAALSHLRPEAPDPVTGRAYAREFHPPGDVARLLGWGLHGDRQIEDGAALWAIASRRGEQS